MRDPYNLSRSLFMVTEPEGDRQALIDTVRAGIRGGVTHVIVRRPRERASDLFRATRELLPTARQQGAWKVLVHERLDVALAASADGAHLTPGSLPGEPAKRLLGPDHLLGISVHDATQAASQIAQYADYILFGHIYETPSHGDQPGRGLDALHAVVEAVDIPVIAIGGIRAEHVDEVLAAGACGVAVIRAISAARDPQAAAAELRTALDQAHHPHLIPTRRNHEDYRQ